MQYLVEIDSREAVTVELDESGRGEWSAVVGDESVDLRLKGRNDDGAYVVEVDGEERHFHVDGDAANLFLTDDRDMVNVDVEEAGEVVLDYGDTERRGELDLGAVESPITGVALEIPVEEGDEVREGDDVMIVEAMKMENTISAPVDGTVREIAVEQDERVFTGDELLHIERNED